MNAKRAKTKCLSRTTKQIHGHTQTDRTDHLAPDEIRVMSEAYEAALVALQLSMMTIRSQS
jgi:hypothetical protein